MPVFPKYYNPQLDENDYRRNMMMWGVYKDYTPSGVLLLPGGGG